MFLTLQDTNNEQINHKDLGFQIRKMSDQRKINAVLSIIHVVKGLLFINLSLTTVLHGIKTRSKLWLFLPDVMLESQITR